MPDTESETARSTRLLIETAKSTSQDLYGLLFLPSPFTTTTTTPPESLSPTTLKRAWRQAALVHHPDKNPGREKESADKLDEIRKAYDILSHEEARRAYDEKVRARVEKKKREEAFEGKRARMREELERREGVGRMNNVWVTNAGDARNGAAGSRSGTPGAAGVGVNGGGGASFGATGTGSPQGGRKRKFAEGTAFGGSPAGEGRSWMHSSINGEGDAKLRQLAIEGARRRQEREEKMRRERDEASRREEEGIKGKDGGNADEAPLGKQTNGQSTPAKKFTFSTPGNSAQKTGVGTGSGTPSSASNKTMFQNTMQRLKEAEQRRKSGLQQAVPQNEDEWSTAAVG